MADKKQLFNFLMCLMGTSGSVWSFLKGGVSSFFGLAWLGPVGGIFFSVIAFIFFRALREENSENVYIRPIANFLSIVAIVSTLFFATSGILMLFYDRSFYGEKKGGPTDYLSLNINGISTQKTYTIKADPHEKTSLEVIFLADDVGVKELKAIPNLVSTLGDTKKAVDRLTVQSTVAEPKKKGYMFLDVDDVNGCDVRLNVILLKSESKKVTICILYTYYSLSKWQKILMRLLERYYI